MNTNTPYQNIGSAEATRERFRKAAERSLDAVKHCCDKMNEAETVAAHALRANVRSLWSVRDMNLIIGADKRINHPIS